MAKSYRTTLNGQLYSDIKFLKDFTFSLKGDMSLRNSDLAVDSPYNTYLYAGLPLGPICNPSAAAIQAALYPDQVFVAEGYLYFCSKDPDTGELHFSKTQAEHDRAVEIYAPLWKAYDQERGI